MATNNATNTSNPITVAQGGTGVATFTTYAPLCGGTTSTGALQQATTGMSTSGFALTSQGAGALPQWAVTSGGAINLVQTLTASNSASLIFTSSNITSSFKSYMIVVNNILPVTAGASTLNMAFSTDNGSTYLSTNYQSAFFYYLYNSTTGTMTSSTTAGVVGVGFNNTGSVTMSGVIYINIPQSAVVSYVGRMGSTTIINSSRGGSCYGTNSGTTTVNNIKFTIASGNISSGTISLYSISQ